jgi:hypothetical protein
MTTPTKQVVVKTVPANIVTDEVHFSNTNNTYQGSPVGASGYSQSLTLSSLILVDPDNSDNELVIYSTAYGYQIAPNRPENAVSGPDYISIHGGPFLSGGVGSGLAYGANIELFSTMTSANSGMRWTASNNIYYDASKHYFRDRDANQNDLFVIDSGSIGYLADGDVDAPSISATSTFNTHVTLKDGRIFTLSNVKEVSANDTLSGLVENGSMIYNEDTDRIEGYVASGWKEVQTVHTEDTEIVFTPDQTLIEIQNIIDELPTDLNGYQLKLLFTPGTYNWYSDTAPEGNSAAELRVRFFGGGKLILEPTTGWSSSINNKQDVIIKGGILFSLINASVHGIRFLTNDDTTYKGLTFDFCPVVRVLSCSFDTFDTYTLDNAIGMRVVQTNAWLNWNVFGNVETGIQCERASHVIAQQNVDELTKTASSTVTGDGYPAGYGHVVKEGAILSIAGGQSDIALSGVSGIVSVEDSALYTTGLALHEDKTHYIDPTMSLTEIQRIVNTIPNNLNGHQVIIEFANGTYDWYTESPSNPELLIKNFESGGITIRGENNIATRHWDHGVIIQGTLRSYGTRIGVQDLKFEIDADISSYGINLFSAYIREVKGCGFEVTAGTANNVTGINLLDGEITTFQNVYGSLYNGVKVGRKCRAMMIGDLDLATLITEVPATVGTPAKPTNYGYEVTNGSLLSIDAPSTSNTIQADVQQIYLDENSIYTNSVGPLMTELKSWNTSNPIVGGEDLTTVVASLSALQNIISNLPI